MKRIATVLLVVVMVLGLMYGCQNAPATPDPTDAAGTPPSESTPAPTEAVANEPEVFTLGIASEPPSLDPGKNPGSAGSPMFSVLFEGLVTLNLADGTIKPGQAESWTISEDGTVYTFTLRENLKWSNGEPLTANDFVYSWLRVMNPATASTYTWFVNMFIKNAPAFTKGEVTAEEVGVKAIDERTLEVTLNQPATFFIQALLNPVWNPVREDITSKYPDKWTFSSGTYVGNGPYKFVEYQIGSYILVEKNENYWNTKAETADQIKFVILPDANTCYAAFQTGEIDATTNIPAADLTQIMATDDRLQIQNGLSFNFLRLNTTVKGLDDMKVRQAISLAFDRKAYLEGIGSLMATPAMGSVPGGLILDGKDFRAVAGDHGLALTAQLDAAKALLAEAGYPDGAGLPSFAIHCQSTQVKQAEILQAQLKTNLGIETTIAPVDSKMFFPMMVEGNYQIGFGGWGGDYQHPMTFLELFMSTASDNCTRWANAEYDAYLNAARIEVDEAKQLEALVAAETLLIEEAPIVPISFPMTVIIMKEGITGWYYTPAQQLYLSEITLP